MKKSLQQCLIVLVLASINCQVDPSSPINCKDLPFIEQLGIRTVQTTATKLPDASICVGLVKGTSTCCTEENLSRLGKWFSVDQIFNSVNQLSHRRTDFIKYFGSLQKIYDDIFFNYRDAIQHRSANIIKNQLSYDGTSNPLARKSLMDAAKSIYEKVSWNKIAGSDKDSLINKRAKAAKTCLNFTQSMVQGLICGFCQPKTINRFPKEVVKSPKGDTTSFKIKYQLEEAIAFSTNCQEYLTLTMELFDTINTISHIFSYDVKGNVILATPFKLTPDTLGQEYTSENQKTNLDNCKNAGKDKTKCQVVAQKYMRMGTTGLDMKSIPILGRINTNILNAFDQDHSVVVNAITNIEKKGRNKNKQEKGSTDEIALDLISFLYLEGDTKENPIDSSEISNLNTSGQKAYIFQTETQQASTLALPGYWMTEKDCPLAPVYNNVGTNLILTRKFTTNNHFCSNMATTCCDSNSLAKLQKNMQIKASDLSNFTQKFIVTIRENLLLSHIIQDKKSKLHKNIEALFAAGKIDATAKEFYDWLVNPKKADMPAAQKNSDLYKDFKQLKDLVSSVKDTSAFYRLYKQNFMQCRTATYAMQQGQRCFSCHPSIGHAYSARSERDLTHTISGGEGKSSQSFVTTASWYTMTLDQKDTCGFVLPECHNFIRGNAFFLVPYIKALVAIGKIKKGENFMAPDIFSKLPKPNVASVDACYANNGEFFGQAACQDICQSLLNNVFRNDDIGEAEQPLDITGITATLYELAPKNVTDFVDIMNYDFDNAHSSGGKVTPTPQPSQRLVRRSRRARVLAGKAKKVRRAQDPAPTPGPTPAPTPTAQEVSDTNIYMNFEVLWDTTGKTGLKLGEYAKDAKLVDMNFETVINDANQNTVSDKHLSNLIRIAGLMIIMLSALISM